MSGNGVVEVTGIILAGGKSRRLGRNKVLLELEGHPLLARTMATVRPLCTEIIVVGGETITNHVQEAHVVDDVFPGHGAIGGLHAGVHAMTTDYGLVVGCDMPFLNRDLLSYMIGQAEGYDVVIPRLGGFLEPLHALYSRHCLTPIEQLLIQGGGRIISFFPQVRVRYIEEEEVNRFDPQHRSFFNINTPQDWQQARRWIREQTV